MRVSRLSVVTVCLALCSGCQDVSTDVEGSPGPADAAQSEALPEKKALGEEPTARPVAWSSVGKGICRNGRNFWYQRVKKSNGRLCTTYSWSERSQNSKDWNRRWNCEASKYYCAGSAEDQCFLQDTDSC